MRHVLWALLLLAGAVRADAPYPQQSIYQLDARLTNQSGIEHGLDIHRGHPVLITMFYASCPAACPLLIDTLRAIERAANPAQRSQLRVLMVSIDDQNDTTAALKALAETRRLDTSRWTLARADAATVRKIAAMLNIQYRRLPDGGFNHSSIVTVLTPQGEIAAQSPTLGKADTDLLAALAKAAAAKAP
jgi:protein SCO1/2